MRNGQPLPTGSAATREGKVRWCKLAVLFLFVGLITGCTSVTHGNYKTVKVVPIYKYVADGFGGLHELGLLCVVPVYKNYP
jgi:hypothetical protein